MCKDISQFLWGTLDLLLEVALRVSGAGQECFPDCGSQLTQQFVFLFFCLTLHTRAENEQEFLAGVAEMLC